MEVGHLPYRKATHEDYVGLRGLKRAGKKKWRRRVADVVAQLAAALEPDEVVLGGWKRQAHQGTAARLPDWRQRQRLRGRIPPVGEGRRAQIPEPLRGSLKRLRRRERPSRIFEASPLL